MAGIEDIDEEDGDERKIATKKKVNYCPCGCSFEDLDDRGYCDHLVGFTNDKKIMEPLEKIMGSGADGRAEPTGNYRVLGRKRQVQPVPKGAKLVNPQEIQLLPGGRSIANKWVSWRVYVDKALVPNKAG